jgi:hypothetical protein
VRGQMPAVGRKKGLVPSFHTKLQTSGLIGVDAEPFCEGVRAGASGDDCDATESFFTGDSDATGASPAVDEDDWVSESTGASCVARRESMTGPSAVAAFMPLDHQSL